MIANILNNGTLASAIVQACNDITAGPLSEMPIFIFNLFGWADNVLCSILEDEIVTPLLNNSQSQAAVDLKVGGVTSGMTNTVPMASIVGIEDSPVHWNLASDL